MICQHDNSEFNDATSQKERNSTSTCSSNSPGKEESPLRTTSPAAVPETLRLQLFEDHREAIQISQRLVQRSVSWVMTLCWSKSLSQECLWTTLLLFHSFRLRKGLRKQQLELTLLSSLSLSLKMHSNKTYPPRELAQLAQLTPLRAIDIVDMQASILDVVDYNAVIPHLLGEIIYWSGLEQEVAVRAQLATELLMIKDYTIFFDRQKLHEVVSLMRAAKGERSHWRILKDELCSLAALKESKIVLTKYSSKMDTQAFLKELSQ